MVPAMRMSAARRMIARMRRPAGEPHLGPALSVLRPADHEASGDGRVSAAREDTPHVATALDNAVRQRLDDEG
jgi:hypothetical protein